MTMPTFHELAGQMFDAFQSKTRANGDTFYCLTDDSPEWMTDILHAAHAGLLPDDFKYAIVREACGFIHDRNLDIGDVDTHDDAFDFSQDVDVYNASLLAWVSSNLCRMAYVDEAIEQGCKTLAEALMYGQSDERREIFDATAAALARHLESLD